MTPDRPLKIAHVGLTALPATVGGLETVVDNLIREQRTNGHDVTLITRWKQAQAARTADPGFPVLAFPPNLRRSDRPFLYAAPRWPVSLSVMWHQLCHRFDVWHAHWIYPTGWMVRPTLDRLGVPLVSTAHGADVNVDEETAYGYRQFPSQDALIREEIGTAHCLTAVSPDLAENLAKHRGTGLAPRMIPNGINFGAIFGTQPNIQDVRDAYKIPQDAKVILSVSRNEPRKGLHHIPGILQRLKDAQNVYWIVVGQGSDALETAFRDAGLADRVRLVPAIRKTEGEHGTAPPRKLVEIYHASDVFVFPTHNEAFGIVALEAMAAGLPVVASDVGGLRSFVRDGHNGFLRPVGDHDGFATAISGALSEAAHYNSLSQAATETAKAFDWKDISAQYIALYRDLIATRQT